jgi:hypothetical protein
MIRCPIPREAHEYLDNVYELAKHCRDVGCSYLKSQDQELPANCTILVAALLQSKRDERIAQNETSPQKEVRL